MPDLIASAEAESIDLLIEDIEEDMFADPQSAIPCFGSSSCSTCCNCTCMTSCLCRAPSPA